MNIKKDIHTGWKFGILSIISTKKKFNFIFGMKIEIFEVPKAIFQTIHITEWRACEFFLQ